MIASRWPVSDRAAHARDRAAGPDRQLQHDGGAFAAHERPTCRRPSGLLGPTLTTDRRRLQEPRRLVPAHARLRPRLPARRQRRRPRPSRPPTRGSDRRACCLRKDELGGLLDQLQPATADLRAARGRALKLLPQLDLANRCFASTIIPSGNIVVDDGALTTRRSDGSTVENYKEFWYGMVGLAGEGAELRRQRQHDPLPRSAAARRRSTSGHPDRSTARWLGTQTSSRSAPARSIRPSSRRTGSARRVTSRSSRTSTARRPVPARHRQASTVPQPGPLVPPNTGTTTATAAASSGQVDAQPVSRANPLGDTTR